MEMHLAPCLDIFGDLTTEIERFMITHVKDKSLLENLRIDVLDSRLRRNRTLGLFFMSSPRRSRIHLLMSNILSVSERRDIPLKELIYLVLFHELAHTVDILNNLEDKRAFLESRSLFRDEEDERKVNNMALAYLSERNLISDKLLQLFPA